TGPPADPLTPDVAHRPGDGDADATSLETRLRAALAPSLQLLRRIGSGGMAQVFQAREPALKRLVAVKVLSGDLASSADARARFEREAQAVAALSHPNIVSIHTVGELDDGTPYFVMQYVEGRSMHARVEQDGALSVGEARRAIGEVAAALAAAHQQGIVHRDIKPANILYEESSGRSLVSDFGIAAMNAPPGGKRMSIQLTATGIMLGTPQYMSPEQLLAEPVGEKTDVYSLGLLAHELLAGTGPFQATSPHELIAAHLRDTPKRLAALRPDVDAELDELVARCLEKDPSKRPTADEVARRLGGVTLLEWPAPGLEELQGKLRHVAMGFLFGSGLASAAMLAVFSAGPRMNALVNSPASFALIALAVAGMLYLGVGVQRAVKTGRLARRALRGGYGWMTVAETLCDTRGDSGQIVTGSREYAGLATEARNRYRRSRVIRESSLLAAGALALPLLVAVIVSGSAGVVGSSGLWIAAAIPLALLAVAAWLGLDEQRAFGKRRRRSRAAAADMTRLAPVWNESFDAARGGSGIERGAPVAPGFMRWSMPLVLTALIVGTVLLVPIMVMSAAGPMYWTAMVPKFANTKSKMEFAEVTRRFALPDDPRVTPLAAGQAFHSLVMSAGDRVQTMFPEREPAVKLPPIDFNAPLPAGLFRTARTVQVPGLPASQEIVDAARRGFSAAEMAYLERIARMPHWAQWAVMARASTIDYLGARYQLPFPADAGGAWSLPISKFAGTKALAYANASRAAYWLARGRPDSAEHALREGVSVGLLMADEGNTLIEQLIGIVLTGIARDALIDLYAATGDPRGPALRKSVDSVIAAQDAASDTRGTPAFAGVDGRDVVALRSAMITLAADRNEMRGLRFEMLLMLSVAPCTNARELVFGPEADVRAAFDRAKRTMARFPSDTALLDLMYESPERVRVLDGRSGPRLAPLIDAVSFALRNPRLAGCSRILLLVNG
ncbi:MAG: serine/threonine-protein kinase, partial [Gemmatimonadaceae bacterium]